VALPARRELTRGEGVLVLRGLHGSEAEERVSLHLSAEAASDEPTQHIEGDGEAKSDGDIMADTEIAAGNHQAKTAVCNDTVLKRIKPNPKFQVAIFMGISFCATFALLGLGYCGRDVRPGDGPERHNVVIQWICTRTETGA
jgi:hypothetical protein